jgi:indolepyruvate ferredoxin oxidoreductase
VQKELREVKGLTVLIYDQTCAAEKRRRRKRGLYPDPPKRVFINERVCEGCGDCSQVSNCVSVQPLETEFGRKRRIDQSNCNKDFSCIEGFCPSFVTVHGGKLRKADRTAADPSALFADLPVPATPALDGAYNILVTGIGGTGVITIGALLGMAAHVDGKACSTLDFTGLSQKNGAVMSHVRIAPEADDLSTVRIAPGGANLILGCDIVVATSIPALSRAERGVTRAIVNVDLLPTASFVINPDIDFEAGTMRESLNGAVSASDLDILDATGLATALMGDSIATNAFMLGFAFQRGAIPLSLEAIMKAIDLNGAAIDMNKLAFSWGRLAAHDLQRVVTAARFKNSGAAPVKRTLDESIAFRAKFLTEYQNEAYSKRYLAEVERARAAEAKGSPSSHDLTEAFAKGLFKLMAYKDEYEVARLYSDGEFAKVLKEQFDGDPSVKVSLAPPLLAPRDKVTGHLRKREFGSWIFRAFDILTRFKFLRGTAFDPFGYTAERRMERALAGEYSDMIFRHVDKAKPHDWPRLVALAKSAELVRGYGHVKEANIAKYRAECARLEAAIGQPVAQAAE